MGGTDIVVTYQPDTAAGTWSNPNNALGAADGLVATDPANSADTLVLTQASGFGGIPAGYEPVGFVARLTGGTAKNTVTTTFGAGYQEELASASTNPLGVLTDIAEGDETTYVSVTKSTSGLGVVY